MNKVICPIVINNNITKLNSAHDCFTHLVYIFIVFMKHYKMARFIIKKHLAQILTFLILILFIVPGNIVAQNDIEVIVHETTFTDTIGAEMVFDFEVINISNTSARHCFCGKDN